MIKKIKNNLKIKNCTKIGSVLKPFGYKGQVVTELIVNIENIKLESIFVEIDNYLVPFFIDTNESRFYEKSATIKFNEINSKEESREIIEKDLYIPINLLKSVNKEEKKDLNSLVGYKILDKKNGLLGLFAEYIEIKKNPLISIDSPKDEILLPLNAIEIIEINELKKEILISLPEYLSLI